MRNPTTIPRALVWLTAIWALTLLIIIPLTVDAQQLCAGSLSLSPSVEGGNGDGIDVGDEIEITLCATNTSEVQPVDQMDFVAGQIIQGGIMDLWVACQADNAPGCAINVPQAGGGVFEFVACADTPEIACEPVEPFADTQQIRFTTLTPILLPENQVRCLAPAAIVRAVQPPTDPELRVEAFTGDFETLDPLFCDPQVEGQGGGATPLFFPTRLPELALDLVCNAGLDETVPDDVVVTITNPGEGDAVDCTLLITYDPGGQDLVLQQEAFPTIASQGLGIVVATQAPSSTQEVVVDAFLACEDVLGNDQTVLASALCPADIPPPPPPPRVCEPGEICQCPMVMPDGTVGLP